MKTYREQVNVEESMLYKSLLNDYKKSVRGNNKTDKML